MRASPLVRGHQRVMSFGGVGSGACGSGLISPDTRGASDPAFRAIRPESWEPAGRPVSHSRRPAIAARGVWGYPNLTDREIARRLRAALIRHREGRWWRRDRIEARCPAQHRGTLTEILWCLLKTHDAIPCDRTIRTALRDG